LRDSPEAINLQRSVQRCDTALKTKKAALLSEILVVSTHPKNIGLTKQAPKNPVFETPFSALSSSPSAE